MIYLLGTILPAILLLQTIDDRNVVISRTAVHQLKTLVAERLRCIGITAQVDNHRLIVVINDKVADIVVVMAFGIVTAFRCYKPVLVARHHNLRVFQINIFRLWLYSCSFLILRQHGEEHQFPTQLRIVARFQEERCRLEGILIFLAHISCQLHHLLILEILAVWEEDVDVRNILSLRIREIHEGKVVDIHRSDEPTHILHLLLLSFIQYQNRLLRSKLHEIERLEERGSGTVPVADAFLATAIIGITLQKGSQTLLHSLEGSISLLGI